MQSDKARYKIVALTGAGISAESGIRTFREGGGLWEEHAIDDVASPEGFERNPDLVWKFYRERYAQASQAVPNAGHHALVRLEKALGESFSLITQNVDGLHRLAGNHNLIEMHGSLHTTFCTSCEAKYEINVALTQTGLPHCPACNALLRPDIVWFGEIPYELERIEEQIRNCELFIVIGTSGSVYPAAGFVMTARYYGAKTLGFNLERPLNSLFFDEFTPGKTGETLPLFVDKYLS